jgi:hypothetical protein
MMPVRKSVVLAFSFVFAVVQASAVLAQDEASTSGQREALLGRAERGDVCAWPVEVTVDALNVLAMADPYPVDHAKDAPHELAAVEDTTPRDGPQAFVTCTGWHALCSASPDCQVSGGKADCDCMRVNETHIVATSEIQDATVKRLTQVMCTDLRPCDVDQAPVCSTMADGRYEVDGVKYDWVSTYSYRGWCTLLQQDLVGCDPQTPGYSGDRSWAICDAAPCTENLDPSDPNRPLSCQCRVVEDAPFVGMNGSCTGDMGGIFSSFPLSAWDFQHDTYPFPMPGYEWVQGACAPLGSDAWEEPRSERGEVEP